MKNNQPSLKFWVVIGFVIAFLFWFGFHSQSFGADKSAYNLYGHMTPDWSETTSVWFTFWDEHIDWQTAGLDWYFNHATRNQVIGTYEVTHIWHDTLPDLGWLFAFYDSAGVHRDSGLAHFIENTYHRPNAVADSTKRLTPGWDKANDANGNWVRDKKADYDYNNATAYFTVDYTSDYIQDADGGRMGTWTANEWQRDYVKMGWGGDADTVAFRVDSNTTTRLYLDNDIPSHTYTWFIVDDSSATNHNAVAMSDTCARIRTCVSWNYYESNCRHWLMRAFAGRFFHARCKGRPYQPSNVYFDDVLKTNNVWSCGSGWCDDIDMGGNCQESLNYEYEVWDRAQNIYLTEIRDSLGTDGFLIVNEWEVEDLWDTILTGGSVDAVWHENWIDGNEYSQAWLNKYGCVRKQQNSPFGYNLLFFHAPGSTTADSASRHKINCYAQYLLMYGDSVYFLYNTSPAYGSGLADTTTWWFGLMGVSIGTPTDTATAIRGDSIWMRPFSNGIVVWKPRPGEGSNYTDTTFDISLGGYYYELTIDGDTTGDSTNSINLRNAESFIGIGSPAEEEVDSLIQTYSKLTTDSISSEFRDSVYTLWSDTCDTVFLYINTSKSFSGATCKDTFINDNVDTLIASGLEKSTKYYFSLIASDEGIRDTTSWDSITTQAGTSPPGLNDTLIFSYTLIDDNSMDANNSTYNYGASDPIMMGKNWTPYYYRIVFKINGIADSLPGDGICDSAYLKIRENVFTGFSAGEYLYFKWYRVIRDWGEGDNTGSTADAGECSWDSAKTGTVVWGTAGCDNTTTDRLSVNETDGVHTDSLKVDENTTAGFVYLWISPQTVEAWRDSSNYGIVLITRSESTDNQHYFDINSAECATAGYRPEFVIYYHTPEETPPAGVRCLFKK